MVKSVERSRFSLCTRPTTHNNKTYRLRFTTINMVLEKSGHGRCGDTMYKWRKAPSAGCDCGSERQTVRHIIEECPIRRNAGWADEFLLNLTDGAIEYINNLDVHPSIGGTLGGILDASASKIDFSESSRDLLDSFSTENMLTIDCELTGDIEIDSLGSRDSCWSTSGA
nr:unnamed protein product [Callosobruchus chinensis]